MSGLIAQLQADASDASIPVSTLLRKVKIAAAKLQLNDALDWVEHELSGYRDELPDYREGRGHTIAMNDFGHWLPCVFAQPEIAELAATVYFFEPVANYEKLLENGEGPFRMPMHPEAQRALMEALSIQAAQLANNVPKGFLIRIVEQVRNSVLDWALELEKAGVTGEGLTFSATEVEAANSANISIANFSGTFNTGNAGGSISQTAAVSSYNNSADPVFKELLEVAQGLDILDVERKAILSAINNMTDAHDDATYISAYQEFMSVAANHLTVFAPFLPALTTLLR
jgi:hypothetical protein